MGTAIAMSTGTQTPSLCDCSFSMGLSARRDTHLLVRRSVQFFGIQASGDEIFAVGMGIRLRTRVRFYEEEPPSPQAPTMPSCSPPIRIPPNLSRNRFLFK